MVHNEGPGLAAAPCPVFTGSPEMAESTPERTILKILSGLQSGVEVALVPGDYSVGSGPDDDIQLVDVSLKPAHLKLRVAAGRISVAGGAGAFRTSRGLVVAQGNADWQEIEPLEVVVAGTTRFALGGPTAQWATITDDDSSATADPLAARNAQRGTSADGAARPRSLTVIALSVALAALGGAFAYQQLGSSQKAATAAVRDEVEVLRESLDAMPFGRAIEVRREVDGTVFATGYVESQVERRAVANAVEKTGVPVHMRVWVLQTIRNEVDNLIKARKLALTAKVSPAGEAVLQGVVLDPGLADRFVALLRDSVVGLKAIDNQIRTAPILLKDVEKLAAQAQVEPYVLFRLDRELIEVSGAIPIDRIDAWVGFLQSYSGRYAKDIALRSLVQIQAESGEKTQLRPVVIGRGAGEGEVQLDQDRVRSGDYDVNELFGGKKGDRNPLLPQGARPGAPGGAGAGGLGAGLGPRAGLQLSGAAAGGPVGAMALAGGGAPTIYAAAAGDARRPVAAGGAAPGVQPGTPFYVAGSAGPAGVPGAAGLAGVSGLPGRAGSSGTSAGSDGRGGAAAAGSGAGGSAATTGGPAAPVSAGASGSTIGNQAGGAQPGRVQPGGVPAGPGGQGGAQPGAGGSPSSGARPTGDSATAPGATVQPGAPAGASVAASPAELPSSILGRLEGNRLSTIAERIAERFADRARDAQNGRGAAGAQPSGGQSQPAGEKSDPEKVDTAARDLAGAAWDQKPGEEAGSRSNRIAAVYLPLFRRQAELPDQACWPGSALSVANLPGTLFWLDLLSVSTELSLSRLTPGEQRVLLEAALNPRRAADCARQVPTASGGRPIADASLYLAETRRNPDFIRFIARDISLFPLEVTGASLADDYRYVQVRNGIKMPEGSAPDGATRIAVVGELGTVVQTADGNAVVLFDPDMTWLSSRY